mmetsp:Transcript_40111/g.65039  ORF Transcript_40111/g.65039 Transcript_40111/m.65039 type:complete len:591 (-) Transcript_40111:433-2205(-)
MSVSLRQDDEFRMLQEQTSADIAALKKSEQKLQHDFPLIKERVLAAKDLLKYLFISDDTYLELKGVKEEDLSLNQWVQLKVHEEVRPVRAELEALRMENVSQRDKQRNAQEEIDRARRELSEMQRMARREEDQSRVQLRGVEERCSELATQLSEALSRGRNYAEKASQYDELKARVDKSEDELRKRTAELQMETQRANQYLAELGDKSQTHQMLALDKTYLTKELENYERKLKMQELQIDDLERRNRELKSEQQDLHKAWLSIQETKTANTEVQQAEIGRLQKQFALEKEDFRRTLSEMHDRETRLLKESQINALQETERLRSSLQVLQDQHAETIQQNRTMQISVDQQLMELRFDLKQKIRELESFAVKYEQSNAALRQSTLECDMYKRKIEILQTEFKTIQSEAAAQNARQEAIIAALQTKNETIRFIAQPSDDQSDMMAKMDDLKQKLQSEKKRTADLTEQINHLREELLLSHQPQSFLIRTVQSQADDLRRLEEELRQTKSELLIGQESQKTLTEDMERLLSQRSRLHDVLNKVTTGHLEEVMAGGQSPSPRLSRPRPAVATRAGSENEGANPPPLWFQKLVSKKK